MSACFEVVRFRPKPGQEDAIAQTRPAMEAAFRERYPNMLDMKLGRLEDGTYVDVFVWKSRADADHAQETEGDIPEFQAFVANVEELVTHDFGDLVG